MSLFAQSITAHGKRTIIGQCLLALATASGVLQHRTAYGMWDDASEIGMLKVSGPLTPTPAEKMKAFRPPTSSEKLQITQAVQQSLIDPESARFGDILVLPNKYACVAVNSKNRFGGYTGFQMVFAGVMEGSWQFLTTQNVTFEKCTSVLANLKD